MGHDSLGPLWIFVPAILLLVISLVLPGRAFGGKALQKRLEETQGRTQVWHQETVNFQREMLEEMRRHNAIMEQQSQLLIRLLERSER